MLYTCKVQCLPECVKFNLCPAKATRWNATIAEALDSRYLNSGDAQKLAGRLNFASQHLFHKLGRTMIKPVYAQKTSGSGEVGKRLEEALRWWHRILKCRITESVSWRQEAKKSVGRLFVDAASTPACCAVVLCIDGEVLYTCSAPPLRMIEKLSQRGDKQITSLARALSRRVLL